MSKALIKFEDVSLNYETNKGVTHAIKSVDFSIDSGDFVVLLGPSGCGKSTLLNIAAGFLKPTTGKCFMNGTEIERPDATRGVVFQNASLFPWYTVTKNIAYGETMQKLSLEKREERVQHYLKIMNLEEAGDQYPFALSGGMKQRVALARALANEPDVLLLDEPFAALDALTRLSMQDLVNKMWKTERQTFFMITHDIDEALKLGSRILVMSPAPGEIIARYSPTFSQTTFTDKVGTSKEYSEMRSEILNYIR